MLTVTFRVGWGGDRLCVHCLELGLQVWWARAPSDMSSTVSTVLSSSMFCQHSWEKWLGRLHVWLVFPYVGHCSFLMAVLADVPYPCLPQKLHVPLSELVGGVALGCLVWIWVWSWVGPWGCLWVWIAFYSYSHGPTGRLYRLEHWQMGSSGSLVQTPPSSPGSSSRQNGGLARLSVAS